MSGGLLVAMAQMLIARAAGQHTARVVGFVAMPVLAGAALQVASWRWRFLINLPVGAMALVLAVLFLPNDCGEVRPRRLDLAGLAPLLPSFVLFLHGADHLSERVGVLTVIAVLVMFARFWRHARRMGEAAPIDLRLLRRKVFSTAIGAMFVMNGVAFAGQMLIPIYLAHAGGLSPSRTGWLMTALSLGMMCG